MKAYILRIRSEQGPLYWVVADATHTVPGKIGESKRSVVDRYLSKHGKPNDGFTRYQGVCRSSEAAMTLAEIQMRGEES